MFSFTELYFVDTTKFTQTAKGLEVKYNIFDPCLVAVIELQCKDSKGSLLYKTFLLASTFSHTIPKRFLSKTYTVNVTVTHPVNSVTIFQQSGTLGQKGECGIRLIACFTQVTSLSPHLLIHIQ